MLPERMLSHSWLPPTIAGLLSVLLLGALLWSMQRHDLMEHAEEYASDADSAIQSVRLHLQRDEEFLDLLASELARGNPDCEAFQIRASEFVTDNPEMVSILWADENFLVRWVAPRETEGQVAGVRLRLPEPERASHEAKITRSPSYTRIFEFVEGNPVLALYTPVYQESRFLGVIGGVYSCEKMLQCTVPNYVLEGSRVSLADEGGNLVSTISRSSAIDPRFIQKADLSPFGRGIQLVLEPYRTGFLDTRVWMLVLLCVTLTVGVSYGMWALTREANERRKTHHILQRERDNLVNVFEAMEDGVAIVTPDLDIQYVNRVIVRDFGPYEGRKCYAYFHGHAESCSWCMMEDVIAGKTVHTEWCYLRNGRTYDLLDTRVSNPDGSVCKLKMFRDITERVEAENALRQSEHRFQQLFERAADALFLHETDGRIVEANQTACDSLGYTREEFLGLSLTDIHVDGNSETLWELLRSEALSSPITLSARQRRKDGSTFPVEVRLGPLNYGGQPLFLASARDTTERERSEHATQKRLEAEKAAAEQTWSRLAESEGLHRVTSALLQGVTLEEVLDVVCREARQLTGATGSGVLLLEDGSFRLTNWTGTPPPGEEAVPVEGSFAGLAVERAAPLFVPDLTRSDLSCYRRPRPESLIVVPLTARGSTIGALDVAGTEGTFDTSHIRILSHFAAQAAIAIEKARLREQAEQLAVMEERHRLARELHDSVTQALYSATLYADAASLAITAGQGELAASHMAALRGLAREAMLEMRLLIFELHPPALEQEGLVGAIQTRLATVETRAGLETDIRVTGEEVRLPSPVEEALYRFAQEALNNVVKHAKARSVRVQASFSPSSARLEILDDGVGFNAADAESCGGIGLRGMKERVEHLGGLVQIESEHGSGTRITAEIAL